MTFYLASNHSFKSFVRNYLCFATDQYQDSNPRHLDPGNRVNSGGLISWSEPDTRKRVKFCLDCYGEIFALFHFFVASHNFWPRVAIIDNFSFHFSRRKPLKLFNKNGKSGLFCWAQEKQFFCFRRRRRSTLGPIFSKAVARLIEFTCNPNFKLSSEINK